MQLYGTAADIWTELRKRIELAIPNVSVLHVDMTPDKLPPSNEPIVNLFQSDYQAQELDYAQTQHTYVFTGVLVLNEENADLATQHLEAVRLEVMKEPTLPETPGTARTGVVIRSTIQTLIPYTQDRQQRTIGQFVFAGEWVD